MFPVTAELKCPHGRGKDSIESEAVTEMAYMEVKECGKGNGYPHFHVVYPGLY